MTGTPDVVAPLTPLEIEGLVRPQYRAYPVADHLADKLCAIVGTYARDGQPASSTRVKDLVDIAIIATTQAIGSTALRVAVVTNAVLRKLELSERFAVPDKIFDPILDATATGAWDPSAQAWIP
jgi:alcohol dehydrogenase class IV